MRLTLVRFLPVLRRELRSGVATISICLIAAAVVSFSLIKILQQVELYLRQLGQDGPVVFTFYSLVVLLGGLGLFFLLASGAPEEPKERSHKKPAEAVFDGLVVGFVEGLHKRRKSYEDHEPPPRLVEPEVPPDRPRIVQGFY